MPENVKHKAWYLIDTGLRDATENIALNKALLQAHQKGDIPNVLRFVRFKRCALVGYHQNVQQEVNVDYCLANGIEIQRRITGGGAIYFDENQLGWELYFDRTTFGSRDMQELARTLCETAAEGIAALGVHARFRPRNDIEVNGKKISGTGGAYDGKSVMYQGTLLLRIDVEKMLRVLKISAAKLTGKMIESARERVTDLEQLLGTVPSLEDIKYHLVCAFHRHFGLKFEETSEHKCISAIPYRQSLLEVKDPDWVALNDRPSAAASTGFGEYKCAGGLLHAEVLLDEGKNRLKRIWINGDFFVNPKRAVVDLENALRDVVLQNIPCAIRAFFHNSKTEMLMVTAEDFVAVVRNALQDSLNR